MWPTRVLQVFESMGSSTGRVERVQALVSVIAGFLLLITGLLLMGSTAVAEETTSTTASTASTSSTTSSEVPPTTESSTTTQAPSTTSSIAPQTTLRPNPSSSSSSSSTTSSTTSASTTTTAARSTGALPGFKDPSSSSGLSTGVKLALVIGGLVIVAAGYVALAVTYWRQTRPLAADPIPGDLA